MLFKLIKFAFYATVIFFALYFFADIRINDVNIRDSLQKTVTPQNIEAVFDEISSFVQTVKEVFKKQAQKEQTVAKTTTGPEPAKENADTILPVEREKLLKLKLKSLEDSKSETPRK
jgi:hypothetical protein